MINITNKEKCSGCEACVNICPKNCITMIEDKYGFRYPTVNQSQCSNCNLCESVCPIKKFNKEVYACYAKNKNEYMSSSSGGAFAVIARKVLTNGGLVCGAAFDENFNVKHMIISNLNDLYKLKGTKYVQSEIGSVYKDIKKYLDKRYQVLFSGTPCEVAGLKKYLKNEYSNLITVDLICHGVPSPKIWQDYLNEVKGVNKIKNVSFRNKKEGISNVYVDIEFDNGKILHEKYSENIYINGFINNLYIRPSCNNCQFKGDMRYSDITLGDFWSIDEFHRGFSQGYGTSAVVLHTEKGKKMFNTIKQDLVYTGSTLENATVWNSCYFESVKSDKNANLFFETYKQNGLVSTISSIKNNKKEKNNSILKKIKNKLGM
ncbi:Coenzyme F420 hydrogenase/dehydrogenase, beta subunit C-terminal domain [Thomasclavelia cocleata]|uniref:Coenzyme F420 hydrogenase/dehydrogenase, beta subunit C-terminal domain n=1 Tax=Thomasclavelia cocleata TaxID=69824 RepID=UPI0024319AE5|nr:Coenzyme F420 hydrogenase/dehydrogenase, beta subunit C-terminal domain [Thomasclavelia cocleata]